MADKIPEGIQEIINTIALADAIRKTLIEKEIDGVELTKVDKGNIIGYLCCDKGPEINREFGYIMMNAIFAWSIGNMTDEKLMEELDGFKTQWRKVIDDTIKISKLTFDSIFGTGPHIDLTEEN